MDIVVTIVLAVCLLASIVAIIVTKSAEPALVGIASSLILALREVGTHQQARKKDELEQDREYHEL